MLTGKRTHYSLKPLNKKTVKKNNNDFKMLGFLVLISKDVHRSVMTTFPKH